MSLSAPRHAIALGAGFALVAAGCFGFVTPLARYAYEFGTNPATAALVRITVGAVVAVGVALVLGRGRKLPRTAFLPVVGVTACLGLAAIFYLSAVAFVPVSLAVLLFYLYPLMVAAYATLFQGRPLGLLRMSAFIIAFGGLAIAFAPSVSGLDWLGVLLGVVSAVLLAGLFLFSEAALRHADVVTVTLYSNVGCVPIVVVGVLLLGGPEGPSTHAGWAALLASGILFGAGMFLNFAAIAFAGSTRTAMVFNIEPVIAMVVATSLLGESLSAIQYAGAALVIFALAMSGLADRRMAGKVDLRATQS